MVRVIYHQPFSHFRVNHAALIAGNLGAELLIYSNPTSKAALDGINQVLEHPEERAGVPVMVTESLEDALKFAEGQLALVDPEEDGGLNKLNPSDTLLLAPVERLDELDVDPDITVGVGAEVGELAALAIILHELGAGSNG